MADYFIISIIVFLFVSVLAWVFVKIKSIRKQDPAEMALVLERLRLDNKEVELQIIELEMRIRARGHDLKKL